MKKFLWWLNMILALFLALSYISMYLPPRILSVVSLFGLTYPVWFVTQLFFLTYWLTLKKRKKAILPFLILLIGWNTHAKFFQINLPATSQETDLKVMTYNVRLLDYYRSLEGEKTKENIFKLVKEEQPDVMCFQEFFYQESHEYETRTSLVDIAKTPNYQEKYTHELSGKRYLGIITMSKYPIINKGEIPFETDVNNFCIYSDIVKNGDTLRVYNTHLSSIRFKKEDHDYMKNDKDDQDNIKNTKRIASRLMRAYEKREKQSKKVLASINESPYPVILCGDFNDTPVSYCYNEFAKILIDSFSEQGNGISGTYIGDFPSFRIDYIFHSSDLKCTEYNVIQNHLSDHKPIFVKIGDQ